MGQGQPAAHARPQPARPQPACNVGQKACRATPKHGHAPPSTHHCHGSSTRCSTSCYYSTLQGHPKTRVYIYLRFWLQLLGVRLFTRHESLVVITEGRGRSRGFGGRPHATASLVLVNRNHNTLLCLRVRCCALSIKLCHSSRLSLMHVLGVD